MAHSWFWKKRIGNSWTVWPCQIICRWQWGGRKTVLARSRHTQRGSAYDQGCESSLDSYHSVCPVAIHMCWKVVKGCLWHLAIGGPFLTFSQHVRVYMFLGLQEFDLLGWLFVESNFLNNWMVGVRPDLITCVRVCDKGQLVLLKPSYPFTW